MSSQDIILCEKELTIFKLVMKINELEKEIKVTREALRRYQTTKENQEHATSIIEIITRLLYIKKENPVEQIDANLSDFCFPGLH